MSSHNDYNRFVRPHYFSEMMLTVQDLQAEQDYHIGTMVPGPHVGNPIRYPLLNSSFGAGR